jgi:hypothetical protein
VFVTNNGEDFETGKGATFEHYLAASVTSIEPSTGVIAGGTHVRVVGRGLSFTAGLMCRFGLVLVPASFVSVNEVRCVSPSHPAPSSVSVEVSINGVDFSANGAVFTYGSPPAVLSIEPERGPVGMVSMVNVTGKGFEAGSMCKFGSSPAVVATYVSPTLVACPTPTTGHGSVAVEVSAGNGVDFPASGALFTFMSTCELLSIAPESGSWQGGTLVNIKGLRFTSSYSLSCVFGTTENALLSEVVVPAQWLDSEHIACITPASGAGGGRVSVTVRDGRLACDATGAFFAYHGLAVVTSVTVQSGLPTGPVTGGTEVSVTGQNFRFTSEMQCRFGVETTPAIFVSASEVRCISPAQAQLNPGSSVPVDLSINGDDWLISGRNGTYGTSGGGTAVDNMFQYELGPTVSAVVPTVGALFGGYPITLAGARFVAGRTSCRFGLTAPVQAAVVSASVATCVAPAHAAGGVRVAVSNNGADFSDDEVYVTYRHACRVQRALPSSGPETGGALVRVTGFGFVSSAGLRCLFTDGVDGTGAVVAVTEALWVSSEQVECLSPVAMPGLLHLRVETLNTTDCSYKTEPFLVETAVSLVSLHPIVGPTTGMTSVTVHGSHFINTDGLQCRFGDLDVAAQFVNATAVRCLTPSAPPGAVEVRVTNNGEGLVALPGTVPLTYTYVAPAAVKTLAPRSGPAAGGTPVTIEGEGFFNVSTLACRFGTGATALSIVSATYASPTRVSCMAPAYVAPAAGLDGQAVGAQPSRSMEVDVDVTVHGNGEYTSSRARFVYRHPPVVSSVTPHALSENTTSKVTLLGARYVEADALVCRFQRTTQPTIVLSEGTAAVGDTPVGDAIEADADWVSPTLVQCASPAMVPGPYSLVVTTRVHQFTSNAVRLSVLPHTVLLSLAPAEGARAGGTVVTLAATNLPRGHSGSVSCRFGRALVPGRLLDDNHVSCVAPEAPVEKSAAPSVAVSIDLSVNGVAFTDSGLLFSYVEAPTVTSVSPTHGDIRGGTVVNVTGSNFRAGAGLLCRCRFGSLPPVEATLVSSELMTCTAPATTLAAGSASVASLSLEVTTNGADYTANQIKFAYVPAIRVTSVGPTSGPESGSTLVTVLGGNFVDTVDLKCRFGRSSTAPGMVVAGRWVSAHRMECLSPPAAPGFSSLFVSNNGVDFQGGGGGAAVRFEHAKNVTITALEPASGVVLGGTSVRVIGQGLVFTSKLTCRFGMVVVSAAYVSRTEVRCESPPHREGSVSVEVSINGVDFSANKVEYAYRTAPSVHALFPERGTEGVVTWVNVTGAGFEEGSMCKFGVSPAVTATYVSPTLVACPSPKNGSGTVAVEVSLKGGLVFSQHGVPFAVHRGLVARSLHPPLGTYSGGTVVRVTGNNFESSLALQCRWESLSPVGVYPGGEAVPAKSTPATWLSSEAVECVSPAARAAGVANVSVTANGKQHSPPLPYTYVADASVYALAPSTGSYRGGTNVLVTGDQFKYTARVFCRFEYVLVAAVYINATQILCVSPPSEPGRTVSVEVSSNRADFTASGKTFTYIAGAAVSSVEPETGRLEGGSTVTVKGYSFAADVTLCRFLFAPTRKPWHSLAADGGAQLTAGAAASKARALQQARVVDVRATVLSPGVAHCVAPAALLASDADAVSGVQPATLEVVAYVEVSNNGQDFSTDRVPFRYQQRARVTAIAPVGGSDRGGAIVKVTGFHFINSRDLSCRFGGDSSGAIPVAARWVSRTTLRCIAPPYGAAVEGAAGAAVPVEVSTNGRDFTADGLLFTYTLEPSAVAINPVDGPTTGGTLITIVGKRLLGVSAASRPRCRFGLVDVPAVSISETELRCHAPPAPALAAASVEVQVTTNGVDWSVPLGKKFNYLPPLGLDGLHGKIHPVYGTEGTTVGLDLSFDAGWINPLDAGAKALAALAPSPRCRFGSRVVNASAVAGSPGRFACLAPPWVGGHSGMRAPTGWGPDGTTDDMTRVDFAANGLDFTAGAGGFFRYAWPPAVKAAVPASAPSTGGVLLHVYGANFSSSASLSCRFGASASTGIAVPAQWMSEAEVRCVTPRYAPGEVLLEVSNNGQDYSVSGRVFTFRADPSVWSVFPSHGPSRGNTIVTVRGSHFINSTKLLCRFGRTRTQMYRFVSATEVECRAPVSMGKDGGFPGAKVVNVEVTNDNHTYTTNRVSYTYDAKVEVAALLPDSGPTTGGTRVLVVGSQFMPPRGALGGEPASIVPLRCRFGDTAVPGRYISRTEVECVSPPQVSLGINVPVETPANLELTFNGVDYTFTGVKFTYHAPLRVDSIWPDTGPSVAGGTLVTVRGSGFPDTVNFACYFGGHGTRATRLSSTTAVCRSPSAPPGLRQFRLSANGRDISPGRHPGLLFRHVLDASVARVTPPRGLSLGNVPVFVSGSHFLNTSSLRCVFGLLPPVRATYISPRLVVCVVPSRARAAVSSVNVSLDEAVPVEVTNNGMDKTASGVTYTYYQDCPKAHYCPYLQALPTPNGTYSSVLGASNFTMCEPGSFQPRQLTTVCNPCPVGYICPDFGMSKPRVCPAGFVCDNTGLRHAAKRCPNGHYCLPGTKTANPADLINQRLYEWVRDRETGVAIFNASTRTWRYTIRPGMNHSCGAENEAPVVPCGEVGWSRPEHPPNTKLRVRPEHRRPFFRLVEDRNEPLAPAKKASGGAGGAAAEDEGVAGGAAPTAKGARLLRERRVRRLEAVYGVAEVDETMEDRFEVWDRTLPGGSLLAERPHPCPQGTWCRVGVTTNITLPSNMSTPQPCKAGFFCPAGSWTAEGSGPCPTGYFCPNRTTAVLSPPGTACPGVGNTLPRDCFPGTYNPFHGQSNCTLCPTGHVCPGFGRKVPKLCPAGFVCLNEGLSAPVVRCPAGYVCHEGTFTLQPQDTYAKEGFIGVFPRNIIVTNHSVEPVRKSLLAKLKATLSPTYTYVKTAKLQPIACASGTFCLGGVAREKTIEWTAGSVLGATSPQICTEGAYCTTGSGKPRGTGACFPGHYCPPGTKWPVTAPRGNFAAKEGSVLPTLCFPGSWAPLKSTIKCRVCPAGYACNSYGTYMPSICMQGSYRSLADSITCRLCPAGTYSARYGLTDVTMCEPCPQGRVCGVDAMVNLTDSKACPSGHVCGEGTNKATQFDHPCPAGYWCNEQSTPTDQYASTCDKGHYCLQGTKGYLRKRNRCTVGYYCPDATAQPTPVETQCPYGTVTPTGMSRLDDCRVDQVHVCDKIAERSYYSRYNYVFQDEVQVFDSRSTTPIELQTGEVEVLRKILPVNVSMSPPFTLNDTVEVFRACQVNVSTYDPKVAIDAGTVEMDVVWVIGRNFRPDHTLVCAVSFNISTDKYDADGNPIDVSACLPGGPYKCGMPALRKRAVYHNSTRVKCQIPPLPGNAYGGNGTGYIQVSNDGIHFAEQKAQIQFFNLSRFYRYQNVSYCSVYTDEPQCIQYAEEKRALEREVDDCLTYNAWQEEPRLYEYGWHTVQALDYVQYSFDFAHLPESLVYDEHYKIAIYVQPSVCVHERCEDTVARKRDKVVQSDIGACNMKFVESAIGAVANPFAPAVTDINTPKIEGNYDRMRGAKTEQAPSCSEAERNIFINPTTGQYNDLERNQYTGQLRCDKPIDLSNWFLDKSVPKNKRVNFNILALEDVRMKVEIHILNGLYLPVTPHFLNTTSVRIISPRLANVTAGRDTSVGSGAGHSQDTEQGRATVERRRLSNLISFEEKEVDQTYIFVATYNQGLEGDVSPPLNLPPRFKDYERGRVLVSFNNTMPEYDRDGTVSAMAPMEQFPIILDSLKRVEADPAKQIRFQPGTMKEVAYWDAPSENKQASINMDWKYRETFDNIDRTDNEKTQVPDDAVMVLPYIPYLSNCDGFDSYVPLSQLWESDACVLPEIPAVQQAPLDESDGTDVQLREGFPRTWSRRKFPPFPHPDDLKYVAPQNVFTGGALEPITDYCTLSFTCRYEESLKDQEITPRWMEAAGDTTLFNLLRYPLSVDQYYQGQSLYDDWTGSSKDTIIPVGVDREAADDMEAECTYGCFPRAMTLSVEYYQVNKHYKRILGAAMVMEEFDYDTTRTDYTVSIEYSAKGYVELIIAFAYDAEVFIILYCVLGCVSVFIAFLFWATVRITTRLENPPKFRFFAFFLLMAPAPFTGMLAAVLPICVVLFAIHLLLDGDKMLLTSFLEAEALAGRAGEMPMDGIVKHYMDKTVLPSEVEATRYGRMGAAFFIFAVYLVMLSAKIFLPKRVSKREQEIEKKRDKQASKESVWVPTLWKRSNFAWSCFFCGLVMTFIVEFSLWGDFGTYIWYMIIGFRALAVIYGMVIERQLKESLLVGPLDCTFNVIAGLVTFGADDFLDFLISYVVEYGMMMCERVYIDPATKEFTDYLFEKIGQLSTFIRKKLKIKGRSSLEAQVEREEEERNAMKKREADLDFSTGDTVEPILDAYNGYANETCALMYQPLLICIMMLFRDPFQLPENYGIKEQDMFYYLLFAIFIVPFQLFADVLIHHVQELFWGWKVYDYLVYTRYRFLQRETRWKGLEDSLDECIEEGMRTLDQMCFSNQFYMMNTLGTSGIMFQIIGIETMLRWNYNMFGDPAMLIILPFVLIVSYITTRVYMWLIDKFGLWRLKHEDTAWHQGLGGEEEDDLGIPRWDELDKIKGASHEAYLMNQKITSETFRYKFLEYNRPWLVSQLPSILTPRTMRRARPYLIAQFTKILGSVNPDISSDSESDDDRPKFGPVALSATSRSIARLWLAQGRRRKRLREVVQPLINRARRNECEQCLGRQQLQVELMIPIEVLGDRFEAEHMDEEFDQVAWKEFFNTHEKFRTLCLSCITQNREDEKAKMRAGTKSSHFSDSDDDEERGALYGPVFLTAASKAILLRWYRAAQDDVRKRGGLVAQIANISDDEEGDDANIGWGKSRLRLRAATKAIAIKWLRHARAKMQAESGGRGRVRARNRAPLQDGRVLPSRTPSGMKSVLSKK